MKKIKRRRENQLQNENSVDNYNNNYNNVIQKSPIDDYNNSTSENKDNDVYYNKIEQSDAN